jgi:DNA polymerase IV
MDRAILHLDLDSFFVSVERLKNSKLVGVPLIIGGSSNRGVVASCSYETRAFGVRSAMPMRLAKRLCPDAVIISGDMESYSKHSQLVTNVIAERAPVYEKASIDEFYLDLSGMDRFFGSYKWAKEMRQRIIKETGLPISMAMAVNKLVSKMGTGEAKPNGQLEIPTGTEKPFIAPMPVGKIPMVGEKTATALSNMGVKTIKTLREVPKVLLEREFGKNGLVLADKANAIDETPVEPYHEQKSLSAERTFHEDTTDVKFLHSVLSKLTEGLAFDLRKLGRLTACVTVKIRYTDFNTMTRQKSLSYTANDTQLLQTAREIFNLLYDRRQLIRLIGVRFSHLVQGSPQISLFDDTQEAVSLCLAMDKIRNKYGSKAVLRAVGMNSKRLLTDSIGLEQKA